MRKPAPGIVPIVTGCMLLFTVVCFSGCEKSEEKGGAPPPTAAAEKVYVIFEGPWALAPDPKDPSKILLIAPKTKSHKDLYVSSSNGASLDAGVYDLSVPVSGTVATAETVGDFAQAKTTATDLQSVLDSKSVRYVIRLPKPEAYVAASRYRSRVGPTYPPDPSTEKDYVSSVSLRYSVRGKNGFSLSGSPDGASFKPLLLNVETPNVNFVIDPLREPDPSDKCHVHSREAFRDLTRLVKVKLYVDYPDSPASCHDTDPQKTKAAENLQPSKSESLQTLLRGNMADVQMASLDPGFGAAYFLFGSRPLFCTGVVIMLKTDQ